MSSPFYIKLKEMLSTIEQQCKRDHPIYWIASMCGYLESSLIDLPDTPEVMEWMDRIIERAKKTEREKEQECIIEQYSNSLIPTGAGTYSVVAGTFTSVIGK